MEEQEIIDRLDKFLDKEGLDVQGKYFITKKMNEEYWEEIAGEGEDDLLDDLGEEEPEEPTEEEEGEEIAPPKPIKKKKITVKKPKVAAKKEEKEEPKEPEGEDVSEQ